MSRSTTPLDNRTGLQQYVNGARIAGIQHPTFVCGHNTPQTWVDIKYAISRITIIIIINKMDIVLFFNAITFPNY